MRWRQAGILALLLIGPMATSARSQSRESVVVQPRVLSPKEYLMTDSTRSGGRYNLPGEVSTSFTPDQDSAYALELAAAASSHARFLYHTHQISELLRMSEAFVRPPTLWESINRMMDIPAEMLAPSPQEVTQYQLNIARSQYVPGVLMFPMGQGNLQVGLSDIARVFGMTEDVSPNIRYAVDQTIEVTVVIYSSSAVRIATLYNGIQPPGAYEVVWNGLTDNNTPAPKGDYVAEVQLGDQRVSRKRIVWPPTK